MLVSSQKDLDQLALKIQQTDIIAIDTEFVRQQEYNPKLCLIQIAISKSEESTRISADIYLIDALSDCNFAQFKKAILRSDLLKIMHGCEQDIEALAHFFKIDKNIPNIFDTQIAALFCNNQIIDPPSYDKLVSEQFGISLDKNLQYSKWDIRPLPDALLEYAKNDVIYLIDIFFSQQKILNTKNLMHAVFEEVEQICATFTFQAIIRRILDRLAKKDCDLSLLTKIIELREKIALSQNTRRSLIIKDDIVIEMSKTKRIYNKTLKALQLNTISELFEYNVTEYIQDYLNARKQVMKFNDKQKLQQMKEAVQNIATNLNISYSLLGSALDFKLILTGNIKYSKFNQGWRSKLNILHKSINSIKQF